MKVAKIYYKGLFVDEVVCDTLDLFDGYFAPTIQESECKSRIVSLIPKDHLVILKEETDEI